MSSAKLNPNSYTEELFQRIISGTDAVLSRLKGSANTSQHIYSVAVIVFSLSFFHLARTLTNSSPFAGVQPSSRDLTSTTDRTNLIGLIRYLLCLIVLVVVVPALHAHQLQPAPGVALQGPDHYTFRVGDVEITALSDGTVPQDLHALLRGTTEANTDALLRDAFQTNPVEASINVFLSGSQGISFLWMQVQAISLVPATEASY